MDGRMNKNQLTMVKENEFDKPLIRTIDSLIDNFIRDCHNKYFHTFDHICEYDLNFTNFGKNETVNIKISEKNMGLYELTKKLTLAREIGFKFNQKNKFKIKIFSSLSNINIHCHLKLRITIMHRQFFRKISQNQEYFQTYCNDRRNPFHFACRQWYLYNNPQF